MLIFTLFIFVLFAVLGIHVVYPFLLRRKSKDEMSRFLKGNTIRSLSNSELPIVSVLIPVYNEESTINQRIKNIFESDYPKDKLEIIVVESGSNDRTRSIIETSFQKEVILITEQERKGKAHAINLGLQRCKGDIIILTDGTTLYDRGTIRKLVDSFKDISIGAVSAIYDVPNREESHVSDSEYKFWLHKDKIRLLESTTHSTSWVSGEACAFRSGIIDTIDEDALADDSNIALQVISKGHRVIVNQDAHFVERSPTQFLDYFRIKSRRTLGGLIETLRFRTLLFNRNYGYFGTIIFPYRFFVYFISPILSCFLLALAIPATIEVISYLGIYTTLLIWAVLILIGLSLRGSVIGYSYTHLFTIIALINLISGNTDVRWTRSATR
jgi:cellulose synthase/poly-beta-1,6-N-acetylglucosamine synthase-like glycosyltransferase